MLVLGALNAGLAAATLLGGGGILGSGLFACGLTGPVPGPVPVGAFASPAEAGRLV